MFTIKYAIFMIVNISGNISFYIPNAMEYKKITNKQ